MSFLFFKQKTAYEMRISDWSSDVCSSDLIVDGFGGQCLGARLAAVHLLGALDDVEQRGVFRAGLRRQDAPPGVHEVLGGHRRAIGPDMVAQLEGIGLAILAAGPALRCAGHRLTLLAVGPDWKSVV